MAIDLERLAKLAYPEESYKQRGEMAFHQFVDALFDFKIKDHDSIKRSQNLGKQPTNNGSNWEPKSDQTENRYHLTKDGQKFLERTSLATTVDKKAIIALIVLE